MKSQNVRLVDVVILGPFMLYLALRGSMSANDRLFLGIAGAATIFYNWQNYKKMAEDAAANLAVQPEGGVRG